MRDDSKQQQVPRLPPRWFVRLFWLGHRTVYRLTGVLEQMADRLPNLVGMMVEISHDDADSTLGWCDDQAELEFGRNLLLQGLDRRLSRPTRD